MFSANAYPDHIFFLLALAFGSDFAFAFGSDFAFAFESDLAFFFFLDSRRDYSFDLDNGPAAGWGLDFLALVSVLINEYFPLRPVQLHRVTGISAGIYTR